MRIGIDISQTAYEFTGVGNYLSSLVSKMIETDRDNEYVLFFSSLRMNPPKKIIETAKSNPRVQIKTFKLPPTLLNILWNKLRLLTVENLIGDIDLFITSDWTEPPTKKALKATIIYDLIVYKYPDETDQKIVSVQKQKLSWVKKESDIVFCISESSKRDSIELLGLDQKKVKVIFPGL